MALFELGLVAIFLIVLAVIALVAFFVWGIHHAIWLAVNSVIGFFALYAVKAFLIPELVINAWSVLAVAVLGIFGLGLVLILHAAGVWF
jgi:hypothetical protein